MKRFNILWVLGGCFDRALVRIGVPPLQDHGPAYTCGHPDAGDDRNFRTDSIGNANRAHRNADYHAGPHGQS